MTAKPTIHSNGTSGRNLTDGYADAYAAVQTAYDAIKQTAPNGRDYYVQGPGALEVAESEHRVRLQKLHDVMNDLEALAIHCDS